ncbi:MAG: neutral/alkaline non-lysosomal ceramidase N-terminal domain-containing protein [Cyclobacteriaceae bacterium]|nr:neutral/alkaline non-lysosomal ceramidase N-terminal domain-containing protein [Flammeovirgaceae bacterium]
MKRFIKWLLGMVLFVLALAVSLIAPIDYTPLAEQPFHQTMMEGLQRSTLPSSTKQPIEIGWSKFNIIPSYSMPMAGYTPKDKYESIHDSVYCRVLAIRQGTATYFVVSADLMLFPPVIKERIENELQKQNKNYFIYLTATHTHSSLGGWDPSAIGRITLGKYHDEWVANISQQIVDHLEVALQSAKPSRLSYFEEDATEYVENRLDGTNGKVDGKLRGIEFTRSDSSRGVLVSYSAHPTTVELLSRIISGDYPNALTDRLEQKADFAVFMAGMVGSHRLKGVTGTDFQRIDSAADRLHHKIEIAPRSPLTDSIAITSAHIPIGFGASQLRIATDWKVRNWAFSSLVGPLQGELTVLQLGNILLIGTPCDFSGEIFVNKELEALAARQGKKMIITSFNGNYTGYVTDDRYYAAGNEEEVMALNWVGPYFGEYYSEMITHLITKTPSTSMP